MILEIRESLRGQFGASIDTLENTIKAWPEEHWNSDRQAFYISFHCLFFLDYFLTNPPKDFKAAFEYSIAEPGKYPEGQLDDITPGKPYTRADLLEHLQPSRVKCQALINGLTEEAVVSRWVEEGGGLNYNLVEMLLYNMRHVQHHAAQLNMLLRQKFNFSTEWVMRAETK